jgi:hypothetical protein
MTNTPDTNCQENRITKLEQQVAELKVRTAEIDSLKEEIRTLKKRQFEMFMDGVSFPLEGPAIDTSIADQAELRRRSERNDRLHTVLGMLMTSAAVFMCAGATYDFLTDPALPYGTMAGGALVFSTFAFKPICHWILKRRDLHSHPNLLYPGAYLSFRENVSECDDHDQSNSIDKQSHANEIQEMAKG